MQVLAHLALGARDATLAAPGELFGSLLVALACDRDALHHSVLILIERQLVSSQEEHAGEPRISLTIAGAIAVESWIDQAAPLFGRWPPDHPAADDAIG
jgi:hypothetical protein